MSYKLKINGTEQTINFLRNFSGEIFSKKLMGKLANFVQFKIKDRTGKGFDTEGKSFEPYADYTVKEREQAGRQTGFVDLNFHGTMMAAMTHTATEKQASIFFIPSFDKNGTSIPEKAADLHYGDPEQNLSAREFFSVSIDEVMLMEKIVNKHIAEVIRNHGGR